MATYEPDELIQDAYGTVVNHPQTYRGLAVRLTSDLKPQLFAFAAGNYTQFDVLITLDPQKAGPIGGGLIDALLFVSIRGKSMFGFDLNDLELHPNYVAEKLNLPEGDAQPVRDLVFGVRQWVRLFCDTGSLRTRVTHVSEDEYDELQAQLGL